METCSFNITGLNAAACLDPQLISKLVGIEIDDRWIDTSRPDCQCYGGHCDSLERHDKCASSCSYCYAGHYEDTPLRYYDATGNLKESVKKLTSVAPKESKIGDFTDTIKVTVDGQTFHFNYNNEIYTKNG